MAVEKIENNNLWIGDSGATSHMTHSEEGLYDIKNSYQTIIVGNGETLQSTKTGKIKIKAKDLDGKEIMFILSDVKYVPGVWRNLFSIGQALKEGATLELSKNMIIKRIVGEKYDNQERQSKNLISRYNGNGLMGISLTPVTDEALYMTQEKEDPNVLHQKLSHPCKEITEITAKHLGIKLDGKSNECEECLLGKAKKKNLKELSFLNIFL
jgi:hypothetical protein